MKYSLQTTSLLLVALLFCVSGAAKWLHDEVDHTTWQAQSEVAAQHAPHAHHAHQHRQQQNQQPSHPLPQKPVDHHDCFTCQSLTHTKASTLHLIATAEPHDVGNLTQSMLVSLVSDISLHCLPCRRGPPGLSV